jgi:hypothetical protein
MAPGFTLEQEQEAFDRQLDALLVDHAGQFVLFHGGSPVAFFAAEATAYEEALKRFGPDGVFLIAPIERIDPQPISVAWDFGVMFGGDR